MGGALPLDLELRKTYLGATDLAVISGLSDYGAPGDVWLEKMGKQLFTGNAATEAGRDLEPVVANWHAQRFGVELVELPPVPIYHPEFPFIAGNPDRLYKGRKRVLECKTAGEDQLWGEESLWGDDGAENAVPIWYLGQTNTYIGLMGYEDGYLSAFFLGRARERRDYPITFDPELYDLMISNGVTFWKTYVEPRIQPPVEMFSPEVAMKAVGLRAGAKKDVMVETTPEFEELVRRWRLLSKGLDAVEARKKLSAAKVAQWMAEHKATKAKHAFGSCTFRQGDPKPAVSKTDYEKAFNQLIQAAPSKIPPALIDEFAALVNEVRAACTTTYTPDPADPVLRPWWSR